MSIPRPVAPPQPPASPEPGPAEQQAADLRRRSRGSKVAGRLLDAPLRTLGAGVAVVVLASTAAFGGLEEAPTRVDAGTVAIGTTTFAPPYDITPTKVLFVDDLPGVYPTEKGNRWIAVRADVTSRHDASLFGAVELQQAVALVGVDGLVKEPERGTRRVTSTYRKVVEDSSDLTPVQPGIPYDMVFLFETDAATPKPDEVRIQIVRHTWRKSSLDDQEAWFDPTVVADSVVPVRLSTPAATPTPAPSAEPAPTPRPRRTRGTG